MSAPDPLIVNVPFANVADPAGPTAPMSFCVHGAGSTGGGGVGVVTATLSIVPVAVCVLSWLEIGNPASTFCGSVTDTVAIAVHVAPSVEYDAAMLLPVRTSFSHFGAVPATG